MTTPFETLDETCFLATVLELLDSTVVEAAGTDMTVRSPTGAKFLFGTETYKIAAIPIKTIAVKIYFLVPMVLLYSSIYKNVLLSTIIYSCLLEPRRPQRKDRSHAPLHKTGQCH